VHALAILREFTRRNYFNYKIIAVDKVSAVHNISARLGRGGSSATVAIEDGSTISIADFRVLWLRRPRANQIVLGEYSDPASIELINNECRGGIFGILNTNFTGRWISTLEATQRASDKVAQLQVASLCGFRIPETLITQTRSEVSEFYNRFSSKVIVKPLVGIQGPMLMTRFLDNPNLLNADAFRVCPSIYQEYISGTRHVRLNCFGDLSFAASIDSEDLDWRPNLNIPIRPWPVPDDVHQRVRRVLDDLGLEMGVVDLKETRDGELVWLEVNPQGQFLFLEALTGMPLASYFADFLLSSLCRPDPRPSDANPGTK